MLVGFNHTLLSRMQEATPATLVLCAVLAAPLAYAWHACVTVETEQPWRRVSPVVWAILGGLSLGVALMSVSGLALIVLPIILLHQYHLRSIFRSKARRTGTWERLLNLRVSPGWIDAALALSIALAVALPWYFLMVDSHGWKAVALSFTQFEPMGAGHSTLPRLIELAPVTLPLGLYGAMRAVRRALVEEVNSLEKIGGSLWVLWLGVACLTAALWSSGPQSAFDLTILVPLDLLAAQTMADLVNRRISVRSLIVLAPATAATITWWAGGDFGKSMSSLIHGRAGATTLLSFHLAVDIVVISVVVVRSLNQWAHHRDDRQRGILAVFIVVVLGTTVTSGLREVVFRHSETHDLLSLRTMVLRRNRELPFEQLAVVSSAWSPPKSDKDELETDQPLRGGRLRFILKTALPRLRQRDLDGINELFDLKECRRLIVLAGAGQRLSYADQTRLGTETIHPGRSGILDAYATTRSQAARH